MNEEIKIEGLAPEECRFLAMRAHYESESYLDPRYYQEKPWKEREELRDRWQQIADALFPDPWGKAREQ